MIEPKSCWKFNCANKFDWNRRLIDWLNSKIQKNNIHTTIWWFMIVKLVKVWKTYEIVIIISNNRVRYEWKSCELKPNSTCGLVSLLHYRPSPLLLLSLNPRLPYHYNYYFSLQKKVLSLLFPNFNRFHGPKASAKNW